MTVDHSPFVLVVDDHDDIRRLIEVTIQRAGHKVRSVADGTEALAIMGSGEPALVILDLMLPRISGWDILTARAADPVMRRIPVIVVTATVALDPLEAYQYGVFAVVQKPFEPDCLLSLAVSGLAFSQKRGLQELS
jgi:two-component system phosphate regulon response regulator PhoB